MGVNTLYFQDYIRGNIISYVNTNTDNIIQISNSKINLKGELVMFDVIYSDQNSDTIFKLESLRTKYIPLIPNHQYDSSLDVHGLELFI